LGQGIPLDRRPVLAENPVTRCLYAVYALASLRASRDFATTYARLYYEAVAPAQREPDRARALLEALVAGHPERREARALLAKVIAVRELFAHLFLYV
jgi:hypothetical protein